MNNRYFSIILILTIVGLLFGLTNNRLLSKTCSIVTLDGKQYEQTREVFSNGSAIAGMSPLGKKVSHDDKDSMNRWTPDSIKTDTTNYKNAREINDSLKHRQLLWKNKYHGREALPPEVDKSHKIVWASSYDKKLIFQLKKEKNRFEISGLRGGAINPSYPDLWPCLSEYDVSKEEEQAFYDSLSPETLAIIKPR